MGWENKTVEERRKYMREYAQRPYVKEKTKKRLAEVTEEERKNKNAKYRDTKRVYEWRRAGLKGDYEKINERYLTAEKCECCDIKLTETIGKKGAHRRKVMDHDHQSGAFRNIVCVVCNNKRGVVDRKKNLVLLDLHRYFNR